jgi:hypothetical protein
MDSYLRIKLRVEIESIAFRNSFVYIIDVCLLVCVELYHSNNRASHVDSIVWSTF